MTKAEAKRMACRMVANLIDAQLGAGWPFEDHPLTKEMSEDDQNRLDRGLRALIDEMDRRGENR
jgi:hypothetical protein